MANLFSTQKSPPETILWNLDVGTTARLKLVHGHLQGDLNATLQLQSQGYTIQQIQNMADEPINQERAR